MAVEHLTKANDDGTTFGQSITDKVSLYGVTPIVQRVGASQATSLVGTASSTAFNTLMAAAMIEIMDTLTALGIWKGAA